MTTRRETGHLLRRAGFGPTPADYDTFAPLTWAQAVDRLVDYEATPDPLPADPTPTGRAPDSAEPLLGIPDMLNWWYDRLIHSPRPLEEKLTFFWHDHFACSLSKVPQPLMITQNQLLRRLALANARELLRAVATDPAMLIFLDGRSSVAGSPNENYARELFELHTLGEGQYTEQDIRETARALTGWTMRPRQSGATFAPRLHDSGQKTIFGRTGAWDVDGVVDLILGHEAFAPFLVEKLARFFIGDQVSVTLLADLARRFAAEDFALRPLLRALFLSDAFRAGSAYRAQIKSPVQFLVGAVRALDVSAPPRVVSGPATSMGQMLFNPPAPDGWPSGQAWVNGNSVLARSNFAAMLSAARPRAGNEEDVRFDPLPILDRAAATDADSTIQAFADLLLDGDIDAADRAVYRDYLGPDFALTPSLIDVRVRGLVHLMLASPAFALA